MKRTFVLAHSEARRNAMQAVQNAPEGHVVTLSLPTRSLQANAAQWPILQAFADQLEWPVNGKMERLLLKNGKTFSPRHGNVKLCALQWDWTVAW